MKTLLAICMLACLATIVPAQTPAPKPEPFKFFNKSDATYWGGGGLDFGSSLNKREANPLFRNSDGGFSPGKNLAFKGALWGAFKLLESHYRTPHERKLIGWFKIGAGIGWAALSIHNFAQPSVSR